MFWNQPVEDTEGWQYYVSFTTSVSWAWIIWAWVLLVLCARLSRFSCVWLFATPWTVALQAYLSMGFSRQEYWSGLPFSPLGDLPNSGIKPTSLMSSDWRVGSLPLVPSGKHMVVIGLHYTPRRHRLPNVRNSYWSFCLFPCEELASSHLSRDWKDERVTGPLTLYLGILCPFTRRAIF